MYVIGIVLCVCVRPMLVFYIHSFIPFIIIQTNILLVREINISLLRRQLSQCHLFD